MSTQGKYLAQPGAIIKQHCQKIYTHVYIVQARDAILDFLIDTLKK